MRKARITVVFTFLVFIGGEVFSQNIVPIEDWVHHVKENNVYFKDVNNIFTNFLGTWEYNEGNNYFKITFYRQTKSQNGLSEDGRIVISKIQYTDRIYSHFVYKLNGITIYDTYPQGGFNPIPFKSYIDGENYVVINTNRLYLHYQEPSTTGCDSRNKLGTVEIERQRSGSTWQIIWERTAENTGILFEGCPNGTFPDTSEYQIPANMVLTKI